MNFIFLMDPLHTVKVTKDTSYIFMVGAHRAGHRVFYLPKGGLTIKDERVLFDVTEVVPTPKSEQAFDIINDQLCLTDEDVDAVFIRTDPPFDHDYLMHTWLLDRLPNRIAVINSPSGVRTVNEKIWSTQFTDLIPPTLITRNIEQYKDYLNEHQKVVAKPTDGHGGEGVFIVKAEDTNASVIFETLSGGGTREIIVQRFIPEASKGDKRILLLDGEILSAVMRVQHGKDHRNNFFAGGVPEPAEITDRDREVVAVLKPHLQALGLHFTGIDMLGDYLIEVNVTSPTCVQECNQIDGAHYEDRVIDYVESLVQSRKEVLQP